MHSVLAAIQFNACTCGTRPFAPASQCPQLNVQSTKRCGICPPLLLISLLRVDVRCVTLCPSSISHLIVRPILQTSCTCGQTVACTQSSEAHRDGKTWCGTVLAVPWAALAQQRPVAPVQGTLAACPLSSCSSGTRDTRLLGPPPCAHLHPVGMQKARVRKGSNKLDTPLNKGRWSGGEGQKAAGARLAGWL